MRLSVVNLRLRSLLGVCGPESLTGLTANYQLHAQRLRRNVASARDVLEWGLGMGGGSGGVGK